MISDFARQASENDQWPEPLLFGEAEAPEISTDLLPCYLGQYGAAVSRATQTPAGLWSCLLYPPLPLVSKKELKFLLMGMATKSR